jgi:hypothetical protein
LPNLAQSRLNKLTSLFYNLIWNNKPDRVKRNTLIGDITQGGHDKMSLTEESVCGFASLRQSKTSLQKLTEISLSFFFSVDIKLFQHDTTDTFVKKNCI